MPEFLRYCSSDHGSGGPAAGGQCTQTGTPIQLSSELLSQSVMAATINNAKTQLATPGAWCICVTNPAPANAPGQPPACTPTAPADYRFNVVSNTPMAITSALNAVSYLHTTAKQMGTNPDPVSSGQTSIAPGEIISIFGQNLGPAVALPAIPVAASGTISSKFPLITMNTASLTSSTKLQFTIASGSGSTAVNCDFTADPNVGSAETLANVVSYINVCAVTAGLAGNGASITTAAGANSLTLTTPATGSAAGITLTSNAASQLFKLTSGSNVTVSGAALAFPRN